MASKTMAASFEIKTTKAIRNLRKILNTEGTKQIKNMINLNEHQKKSSKLLNHIFSK